MLTAVTGATGFLGLRLVRELLQRGEQLLLLARAHRVPVHVRIERFLIASKAGQDELRAARTRIETVDIELEAPLLGLDRDCFQKLADRIDTLWHCAGNISLSAPLEEVRLTNVEGTRHVLQLLSAGERDPVLSHISTVAVAGAQPGGVVEEKILHGRFGFNTFYEQSKFEAEALVHLWVERHAGRALIFRPSGRLRKAPPTLAAPRTCCKCSLRRWPAVRSCLPMQRQMASWPYPWLRAPRSTSCRWSTLYTRWPRSCCAATRPSGRRSTMWSITLTCRYPKRSPLSPTILPCPW